jgi:hypothetical protein
MKPILIILLIVLSCIVFASQYKTIYNPFTNKFDYVSNVSYMTINCSQINFSGTLGASGICDGTDATGAGSFTYSDYFNQSLNTSNSVHFNSLKIGRYDSLRMNEAERVGEETYYYANISIGFFGEGIYAPMITINGEDGEISTLGSLYASGVLYGYEIRSRNWANVSLAWIQLGTYPAACPAGSYLTQLGDAVVCTHNDGNSTTQIRAVEVDALHDTCAEISGCVQNAITNATMNKTASDLICTNCIGATEISELADADISNTLTCSDLVAGSSVVSDAEVDNTITASNYLLLTGGTVSGNVAMSNKNITGVQCITFNSGGKICTG